MSKFLFWHSFSGKHFKVLFAYKAAFRGELNLREGEIIIGKERDRNGWMLGTKLKAKEEGWFPAVYVDQVCVMFYVTVKNNISFFKKSNCNDVCTHLNLVVLAKKQAIFINCSFKIFFIFFFIIFS